MSDRDWDNDPELIELEEATKHLTIEELDQLVDGVQALRINDEKIQQWLGKPMLGDDFGILED